MDELDGSDTLPATRRSLHGVAELVIAGPQFHTEGSIELRVRPGGFGGLLSPVRVEGAELVWDAGRTPLVGTYRALAEATGREVADLTDVYADGAGVGPDEELTVDRAVLDLLLGWFERGDTALRAFADRIGTAEEAVLWPEHFDVGYAVDEVNYGISPGDAAHPGPYAYVGPWTPRSGDFWNASFGALRPAEELPGADDVVAFFEAGRAATR